MESKCAMLIVLLSATWVYAWNEPTGFGGVPWGATPEVIKKVIPNIRCSPATKDSYASCTGKLTIEEVETEVNMTLPTGMGGMHSVLLRFASTNYERMKDIFIRRYGQPTIDFKGMLMWQGNSVVITITPAKQGSDKAGATLITKAYMNTQ